MVEFGKFEKKIFMVSRKPILLILEFEGPMSIFYVTFCNLYFIACHYLVTSWRHWRRPTPPFFIVIFGDAIKFSLWRKIMKI